MLRSPAVISSSPTTQQPQLLEQAWALPVARRYAPLLSQSVWSICGPTSVANVLRSMGVDSGRNPFTRFGLRPMSLDQVVTETAEVLPQGWAARAVRPRTVEALRHELRPSNDPKHRTGEWSGGVTRGLAKFERG